MRMAEYEYRSRMARAYGYFDIFHLLRALVMLFSSLMGSLVAHAVNLDPASNEFWQDRLCHFLIYLIISVIVVS